jgi:hypothetical protein
LVKKFSNVESYDRRLGWLARLAQLMKMIDGWHVTENLPDGAAQRGWLRSLFVDEHFAVFMPFSKSP